MSVDSGRGFRDPGFDVVLRGYDRQQVDEHVARLNRTVARLRGDLEQARAQAKVAAAAALSAERARPARAVLPAPGTSDPKPVSGAPPSPLGPGGAGPRPSAGTPDTARPSPHPRPGEQIVTSRPGDVAAGSEFMHAVLAQAQHEAEQLLAAGGGEAHADDVARAQLVDLIRRRDAVLGELARVRAMLESLLGTPVTRTPPPLPGAGRPMGTGSASPRPLPRPRPRAQSEPAAIGPVRGPAVPPDAGAGAGPAGDAHPAPSPGAERADRDGPADATARDAEGTGGSPEPPEASTATSGSVEEAANGRSADAQRGPDRTSVPAPNGSPGPSGNRWPSLPA